jgi:hypothetical protein
MLYQTITLALLEAYPDLHRRLRMSRQLHKGVERYSIDLRREYLELCQLYPQDMAKEMAVSALEQRIAQEAVRLETAT